MSRQVVVIAAVAGTLLAGSAYAQKVEYHGQLLDAVRVPQAALPSNEIASAAEGEELALPGRWGGTSYNHYQAGPGEAAWRPGSSNYDPSYDIPNGEEVVVRSTFSTASLVFPIHLPGGALLTSMTLAYRDTNTGNNPSAGLYRRCMVGTPELVAAMTPSAYSAGYREVAFSVADHTVMPVCSYYVLAVIHRASDSEDERIVGVRAYYKLQVAPAPATATFPIDVPTSHPFFRFVEALAAAGVTGGCGTDSYCPDTPVTRGQMAVFLATALGMNPPWN
jgi:hypothetical protein